MGKDTTIFERLSIPAGTMIMHEGDPGNCAYLVQAGKVVVYTEYEGRKVELARLGVGEIFGEMALGSEMPRSASVQALEDCNLIVISREVLRQKLDRSDSTVQAIVKMLIRRMASTNEAVVRKKVQMEDLAGGAQEMYLNIFEALPATRKDGFEAEVKPKLDEFVKAVEDFEKKFPPL